MVFADELYIGDSIRRRKERVVERMKQGKFVYSIYCVTKASNGRDLYDIYRYEELRQPYYKKHPVTILGIAGSWEEAVGLVVGMLKPLIEQWEEEE